MHCSKIMRNCKRLITGVGVISASSVLLSPDLTDSLLESLLEPLLKPLLAHSIRPEVVACCPLRHAGYT